MFDASRDSILAMIGQFGPSIVVVSPFLPVLILALGLLILARSEEPASDPIPPIRVMPRRRRNGFLPRPEHAVAATFAAVVLVVFVSLGRQPL